MGPCFPSFISFGVSFGGRFALYTPPLSRFALSFGLDHASLNRKSTLRCLFGLVPCFPSRSFAPLSLASLSRSVYSPCLLSLFWALFVYLGQKRGANGGTKTLSTQETIHRSSLWTLRYINNPKRRPTDGFLECLCVYYTPPLCLSSFTLASPGSR